MQDLLGLGDTRRIRAVAGLAGGVGHKGAVCGIVTGGALALALAATRSEEDQATITARGSMLVSQFIRRFERDSGSALCRDIAQTDFDDDSQVRRYLFTRSRICLKAASRAAAHIVDLIEESDRGPVEKLRELNNKFFEHDYHCAFSVVNQASELMPLNQMLGPNLLIPLNGGIGYSGSTCSALLGGCIAIGLAKGGDTSQVGMATSIKRAVMTLLLGASAFSRLDLSPANDALLRCAKLYEWFELKFGATLCKKIIGFEFADTSCGIATPLDETIERCKLMGAATAEKAAELAR